MTAEIKFFTLVGMNYVGKGQISDKYLRFDGRSVNLTGCKTVETSVRVVEDTYV